MTLGSPSASIPLFTLADPIRDRFSRPSAWRSTSPRHTPCSGVRAEVHVRGEEGVEGRPQRRRLLPRHRPREEEGGRHLQRPLRPRRRRTRRARSSTAPTTTPRARAPCWRSPRPSATAPGRRGASPSSGSRARRRACSAADGSPTTSRCPTDYKIVADINIDMVSRNDGKSIGVTPSKRPPEPHQPRHPGRGVGQGRRPGDQVRRRPVLRSDRQRQLRQEGHPGRLLLLRHPRGLSQVDRRRREGRLRQGRPGRPSRLPARLAGRPGPGRPEEEARMNDLPVG